MSQPWMKFYPRDWRGDQALRAVSVAARGFWMECLCIMHEAKPYGHLVLNGESVEGEILARMTATTAEETSTLLAELHKAGVASITGRGVVFSRRMIKDAERAKKGKKSAQKRWAQPLEKQQKNDGPNGSANGSPTTQKPETRYQKEKREPKGSPKKTKRGTRISDDWKLPDEWCNWAIGEGLPFAAVLNQAEQFHDYWLAKSGKDATKVDWLATWRSWIRNHKKWNKERANGRSSGAKSNATDNHLAGIDAALRARRR